MGKKRRWDLTRHQMDKVEASFLVSIREKWRKRKWMKEINKKKEMTNTIVCRGEMTKPWNSHLIFFFFLFFFFIFFFFFFFASQQKENCLDVGREGLHWKMVDAGMVKEKLETEHRLMAAINKEKMLFRRQGLWWGWKRNEGGGAQKEKNRNRVRQLHFLLFFFLLGFLGNFFCFSRLKIRTAY